VTSGTLLIDLIIVGVILGAVLLLFVVFVIRRMRERRRRLAEDLAADKGVLRDRAFNAMRLASAEAAVLERDRIDTSAARALIAQGEAAIRAGDDYRALTIGRNVQDTLVRLRHEGKPTLLTLPVDPEPLPTAPEGAEEADPLPRLAATQNPAAARFQIRLLTEEIAQVEQKEPAKPGLAEALRFQSDALDALERNEVTAALGLALKGRRAIGARVESLPPTAPLSPPAPPSTPIVGRPATAPVATTARPRASVPCPTCGRASKASDLFCRYCGAPVGTARCPRCQAPLEPEDRFCARCGASSGG
jgi:hypothetical protein